MDGRRPRILRLRQTSGHSAPWLVVMTDFVFALMFAFAALIGEVDPFVFARDVPLPTASKADGVRDGIAVVPRLEDGRWVFQGPGGEVLGGAAVVARARQENKAVVLLLGKDSPVEMYLAAREALIGKDRAAPVPIALGVRRKE